MIDQNLFYYFSHFLYNSFNKDTKTTNRKEDETWGNIAKWIFRRYVRTKIDSSRLVRVEVSFRQQFARGSPVLVSHKTRKQSKLKFTERDYFKEHDDHRIGQNLIAPTCLRNNYT